MAGFTVTTLADENDAETGAGPALGAGLSLREAIALANADSDADTIEFASDLSGGTITLAHGQLEILDSVTIDAGGLDSRLTLDAGGNSRVLHLVDGDIGIENININNGTVTGDGTTHAYGGGVLIEAGNTTLTNVVFDGNRAFGGPDQENGWGIGGAIYVEGSATLNLVVTEDIDQPNTNFAVVGDYYQAGCSNYFNAGFIFLDRDAVDLTITVADGVQYDVAASMIWRPIQTMKSSLCKSSRRVMGFWPCIRRRCMSRMALLSMTGFLKFMAPIISRTSVRLR